MSENLQVWVRNDKGQVYGPLSPPSVELLIDNQVIGGRMQVSTDGVNYVFPGRVPGLRMIFPKETWGDTVIPGEELDAQWQQVVLPASIHGQGPTSGGAAAPPGGPVGAPVAGPGVRGPVAGPGARGGPTAGPGTRQQPGRPMNPAQFGAQGRAGVASTPSGIAAAPVRSSNSGISAMPSAPVRSSPSVADFMNAGAPAPAAPSRPAPSVADFMNAPAPAAPVRSAAAAPVAEPRAATPSAPRSAPASSSSGVRMAPVTTSGAAGDLQVPASGSLGGDLTPLHLYYFAAASEVTGLLTVKLADRELVAHFKKGNPEFLDSTHLEDSLDTFLVAQKLATPAQIQQALAQGDRFGGELLPALFGLGLINPNAVFQHLGQRASHLLLRLLAAEQGTFTFDHEELPAARSMPLGNKWAVYLEALRRVPGPDLRRRLMSALDLPVMKAGGRVAVSDLRLTPQETRALNYFDGVRSLGQLLRDVPAEGDTILRTAWMLEPLELVSFAGINPSAPRSSAPPPAQPRPAAAPPVAAPARPNPPAPAPAAPAPQRPPPPVMAPQAARPSTAPGNPVQMPKPGMPYPGGTGQPAPPAAAPPPPPQRPPPPVMKPAAPAKPVVTAAPALNAEAETKQLQATHDQMKKQNFFEVLGLKRDADPGAVKIAYLKAARSYHPDTVAPGSPEALAKLKADIFALISEANRTLSDAVLRADYAAELDAGGTGSKVDMEKIFRGEELFQKGRILVQARKYPDALKLFEEAVSCNPDEAEFYAWRGYAKFLQSKDKKLVTADVMKDLNLCVSKNPNVASAFYFLGYVQKANGDEKAALANFKKCVALDPKHIDAQRELRSAKK